jgi:F-type H+-transporting ATPase subunit delta
MAESTTVARPYAQAVFQRAQETQSLDTWSSALSVAANVAANADMQQLIDSPKLTEQQLADLFAEVCGEGLGSEGRNLVRLLAENRRLSVLPEIAALYEQFRSEAEGAVQAQLITAFPATDAQKAEVVAALKKRLGKDIQLEAKTDSALLGGAVIRAGDLVIDGSVRGKLARLATALGH